MLPRLAAERGLVFLAPRRGFALAADGNDTPKTVKRKTLEGDLLSHCGGDAHPKQMAKRLRDLPRLAPGGARFQKLERTNESLSRIGSKPASLDSECNFARVAWSISVSRSDYEASVAGSNIASFDACGILHVTLFLLLRRRGLRVFRRSFGLGLFLVFALCVVTFRHDQVLS